MANGRLVYCPGSLYIPFELAASKFRFRRNRRMNCRKKAVRQLEGTVNRDEMGKEGKKCERRDGRCVPEVYST